MLIISVLQTRYIAYIFTITKFVKQYTNCGAPR